MNSLQKLSFYHFTNDCLVMAHLDCRNDQVSLMGLRLASFGPAFSVRHADGQVTHGWDPVTLSKLSAFDLNLW